MIQSEFIFHEAPFASCHASTIAEGKAGLVVAFFAGSREGAPDVAIWLARQEKGGWPPPQRVADGEGEPCWNPVLFQPAAGPLLLFYKVGPNPRQWWGMLTRSDDGGRTWSAPERLPAGILGPIKNKPIQLADNSLVCPSSTEHVGWRLHLEHSPDLGGTWRVIGPLNDGRRFAAIQPTLLAYPTGRMQLLCRTQQGCIAECWSEDGGESWTPLAATPLPNPDSGIDGVRLHDGWALLVYNHSATQRTPLNVALSADGRSWQTMATLEDGPGEYSYPAVIQTSDSLVHISYTWRRQRIRHGVLKP